MPQCSERGTGALPERPRPPSCHHPSICHPRSLAICHLSPSCECVLLPRRLSCTQTAALPMSPKARQAPCSADVRSVVLANIAVPFIRLINAALDTPARLWSLVFNITVRARRPMRPHPQFRQFPFIQHTYPPVTPKPVRSAFSSQYHSPSFLCELSAFFSKFQPSPLPPRALAYAS